MHTKAEFFQYLDSAIKRGDVNQHTGNAWRGASKTVMSDLEDEGDVEKLDVRAALLRYNNKNPHELSGDSLKKYEQRAKTAIAEFLRWKNDPMGYKPPSKTLGAKTATNGVRQVLRRTKITKLDAEGNRTVLPNGAETGIVGVKGFPENLHINTPNLHMNVPKSEPALIVPFPLRPGVVVTMTIPQDLSTDEAKRLSVFILALGHDAPKAD